MALTSESLPPSPSCVIHALAHRPLRLRHCSRHPSAPPSSLDLYRTTASAASAVGACTRLAGSALQHQHHRPARLRRFPRSRVAKALPPSPAFGKASVALGTSARSPPQHHDCPHASLTPPQVAHSLATITTSLQVLPAAHWSHRARALLARGPHWRCKRTFSRRALYPIPAPSVPASHP